MNPVARKDGLVVRELPGEMVVYDLERHEAHCLNATAAAVFRAANGRRCLAEIARVVAHELEPAADEALVDLALERLVEVRLVDMERPVSARIPRREVIRRVGLGAAVLLPLVTSVLAPTPAEALATCVTSCVGQPAGTACNTCGGTCTGIDFCDGAGQCSDPCDD